MLTKSLSNSLTACDDATALTPTNVDLRLKRLSFFDSAIFNIIDILKDTTHLFVIITNCSLVGALDTAIAGIVIVKRQPFPRGDAT